MADKVKHLGELNSTIFFCKGCGIHQAKEGAVCPWCELRAMRDEPEISYFPIVAAAIAGIAVVLAGLWLAATAG